MKGDDNNKTTFSTSCVAEKVWTNTCSDKSEKKTGSTHLPDLTSGELKVPKEVALPVCKALAIDAFAPSMGEMGIGKEAPV